MMDIEAPALAGLSDQQINGCLGAADDIRECYRVLEKAGLNVVGEVLKGQGPFYEMDHYPKDDVYDREFHSQYYYHAHREDHDEHGHFHLFIRQGAMPDTLKPLAGPTGEDRVAHVVAIAMDAWGYPTDLFAVNRWVTDESWFPARAVIDMLDRFAVDHAHPNLAVNRWITAMVRCFRPYIESLLFHRDRVIAGRGNEALDAVLEDRALEITGSLPINLDDWCGKLEAERARRVQRQVSVGQH